MSFALVLLLAARAASASVTAPPELPEDLGPATIDVSDYPPEQRQAYDKILLPVSNFLRGGAARLLNSPLIELDPRGEEALRREHPELFADPRLAQVSPDGWRREAMRIKNRPPCCGACPVLTMNDARALWRFLVYDSIRRKTGPRAAAWAVHRRELVERFAALSGAQEKRK